MLNKKNQLIIVIICILLVVLLLGSADAKNLGMIDEFTIYGNKTRRTGFVIKEVDNRKYVVNMRIWENPKIVVKSMIVNYYGEWRSPYWGETYEGTRNTFDTNAKGGYQYALDLKRQYVWDEARDVDGSWSPDEY